MDEAELLDRTMRFAVEVTRFCATLQDGDQARHVAHQLFRAATSTAANYRSACRGRSRSDFIAKLGIVEEEADEAVFWLEFIGHGDFARDRSSLAAVTGEARELRAIFGASHKTAKTNLARRQSQITQRD
jgi:four helix bundle protein